ncbi:MAG: hypothetical protein ABIP53_01415, partial [Candidatus Limnocylindrales bacterium]
MLVPTRRVQPGLLTCPRLGPRDTAKRHPGAVRLSIGVQAVELPDVTLPGKSRLTIRPADR